MAGAGSRKGGKRKAGRSKDKCKKYKDYGIRERNRTSRLEKQIKKRTSWIENKFKQGKITEAEYRLKLQAVKNQKENDKKLIKKGVR